MKRILVLGVLAALAAVLLVGAYTVYAQQTGFTITLNTTQCKPGSGVLVTIAYTGQDKTYYAGYALELHFTNSTGDPAPLKVVKVYKGSVEVEGTGYAIVTLDADAEAVFSIKAPSKPGNYTLAVYDIVNGTLLAQASLRVTLQTPVVNAPTIVMQHPVVILALLLLLAAILYYFTHMRPA
ncbi:MAG: hypothetical protein GXO09_00845 [Crenarchaeota archaeon]|nr:hypothetical protein [Thermoproteota archaeon]